MIVNKRNIDKGRTAMLMGALSVAGFLMLLLLQGCARMGNPDGGWFDETPPRVIGADPAEGATNVKKKKVLINFDEYIKIDNPTENVVVSPPQLEAPEIKGEGKRISVQLVDSLKPNTTYTIDFSNAISDNNEGNPLGDYAYTFSTGDHIDTAVAIAKQLGIVADRSQAITGADLDRMSDEELDAHIEDYGVYARVQPEHKTRIVEAWKSRDQIVAMTGDGVNDAPSIKRADIGVGMGITGTDVTKNVADMVLADDNFATIIGACEEGRRIYDNIRKVIQFLLSANLAEVFSVFIATLIGFTIFQPVQLLWVNLVTDCFPALALGMEDAEGDIMKRRPRNAKDGVFAGNMGLDCVVQGLIITVLVLASFFVGVYFDMGYIHIADMIAGNADEEGVMMAFITLNMVEIFHCFNMRSRRTSLFKMKKQNKWLWASAALALVLTVIVTVQPTLAEMFFGPVTLELKGVLAALGLAFLIIPLMEIYKAIMRAVEKE